MTFDEFMDAMRQAEDAGFVKRVCQTHDGLPMTPLMEEAWEEGYDPCLPVFAFTEQTLKEHFE